MAEIEPLEPATGPDTGSGPVATEPVTASAPSVGPVGPPARPRGMLRWGVALAVLAIVVGAASAGAVFLAAGSTATSRVAGWLPADTVVYGELRADFPGDQKANLGAFLAKFPGFKDQAALDSKIDQALDRLLDKSQVSWTNDIKPWLAGEVGVGITTAALDSMGSATLGGLASGGSAAAAAPKDGLVVIVATKDAAKAEAWLAARPMLDGAKTTVDYAGTKLTTVAADAGTVAYATKGSLLFLGHEKTVKAALDTNGKSALAASASFTDARATATGDYLGFVYLGLGPIVQKGLAAATGARSTPGPCLTDALAGVPAWFAGLARVEPDSLAVSASAPLAAGATRTKEAASELAKHLPASTVAVAGQRDGGKTLVAIYGSLKKELACTAGAEQSLAQVDQALALLGGIDALIGWAGDTGLAVTLDGTTWGGGIVAVAADDAAAKKLADQLAAYAALAGAQASTSLKIGSQAYGDGTITTVEVPLGFPGGGAPPIGSVPATLTVGFTYQRGVFVLGTLDFVKAVVDTQTATSLASASRYTAAIERAGGSGVSEAWLDVAALRGGIEALLPADSRSTYLADMQPYLAPFDVFVAVGHAGDPETIRMLVNVR